MEEHVNKRQKDEVQPTTGHKGLEGEQRYSSTISVTLALEGDWWSTRNPGRFTPGKELQYTFYRRVGGTKGRSGLLRETPPPGFDPWTVQL